VGFGNDVPCLPYLVLCGLGASIILAATTTGLIINLLYLALLSLAS
jgi:hypothetical protein